MKVLLNFSTQIILSITLLCCIMCESKKDSAKESAQKVNKKVFDDKAERTNAQFVVEAVDQCYAVLEIAKLGQARGASAEVKDKASKIMAGQDFLIQEFQNYAAAQSVSAPMNGPEKTDDDVKKLYKIELTDFDSAWEEQMLRHTRKLIHDFEHHDLYNENRKEDSGTEPLVVLVDEALSTLRAHEAWLKNEKQPEAALTP